MSNKRDRMAAYRAVALVALAAAVMSGLIGIWYHSAEWGGQAAVLVVVAFVFGLMGMEL